MIHNVWHDIWYDVQWYNVWNDVWYDINDVQCLGFEPAVGGQKWYCTQNICVMYSIF